MVRIKKVSLEEAERLANGHGGRRGAKVKGLGFWVFWGLGSKVVGIWVQGLQIFSSCSQLSRVKAIPCQYTCHGQVILPTFRDGRPRILNPKP